MSTIIETNSLLDELKTLNNDLKVGLKDIKSNNTVVNSKFNTNTTTSTTSMSGLSSCQPIIAKQALNMDGLSDFVLTKTEELVMNGLDTVKDLQQTVGLTLDGKVMAAYANIIAATNTALATLNAINIERSKQKATRELKELDIASKKEIGPAKNVKNTVNLIANRETILKMLGEANSSVQEATIFDIKED